ncbi:hypothetical protein EUA93_08850 [Nocardioides oleivorans]|uniref:Uncharacterized protein n=1 Tax=Nocardioides oleivorans TaxID=273676 RepID=A0A4Q2RYT0_9ACTN|nr:hypothetical protein [Nocardioides oleivorans]RYB94440.1 hypothetical protein EUA93_08850 [Nocardioides oleivorans]
MGASTSDERLRFQRVSAAARRLLSREGESGRFEFKQTSKAVDSSVLVAAANWVSLEPSRTEVTILAGVAEVTDPVTGLTTGKPIGLTGNDLAVHVRRIQDYARATLPVPVSVRIIEEGVSTKLAFLRIEVRPTRAPHFDGSGRRITRDGAAHRPLMDEELLAIYLDRESLQFEARFDQTARRTIEAVESLGRGLGGIAGEVERLPGLIDNAEGAAAMAGYEADDAKRAIDDLGRALNARVDKLEERLARHLNRTPLYVLLRLRYVRERVWRSFCVDRELRPSKAAEKLAPRLLRMLNEPLVLESHVANLIQLQDWEAALKARKDQRPASMRWWSSWVKQVAAAKPEAAQHLLRDDPEAIRDLVNKAKKWSDVELEPWPARQL